MEGQILLTACSDARKESDRAEIEQLKEILCGYGFDVCESRYLYDDEAAGREKAEELNRFFAREASVREAVQRKDEAYTNDEYDNSVSCGDNLKKPDVIMDVSGGNTANELLPYLDYEGIAASSAVLFGYSDLTTVINAIYAKTGKASVLYQVRHLVGNEERQREVCEVIESIGKLYRCSKIKENVNNKTFDNMGMNGQGADNIEQTGLMTIDYHLLQGKELHGTLIGGNLRCFLKLAGTGYMPELTDKVLLMEALGGDIYSVRSMLAQLIEIGAFDRIRGIVVGTFTELMKQGDYERLTGLLSSYIPKDMPVVVTGDVGHGRDAKGIWIGREIKLS